MVNEFWKHWKNKTELEIKAIESIQKAKQLLFENIPKEKIISIYIKGSFVRREMNEKSDVDIVIIVNENKILSKIQDLEEKQGKLYKPSELGVHSLYEFKTGKRYLKSKKLKGGVDIFLKNLHQYKLIYGKPINIKNYQIRSDIGFLKGMLRVFRRKFIPLYQEGKFGFSEIMKQVFWLVEAEERIQRKEIKNFSWKALDCSIKDKNHIIHDIYKHRLKPIKNEYKRKKMLIKLDKHLTYLEGKYFPKGLD